jgi:hypothetical protein
MTRGRRKSPGWDVPGRPPRVLWTASRSRLRPSPAAGLRARAVAAGFEPERAVAPHPRSAVGRARAAARAAGHRPGAQCRRTRSCLSQPPGAKGSVYTPRDVPRPAGPARGSREPGGNRRARAVVPAGLDTPSATRGRDAEGWTRGGSGTWAPPTPPRSAGTTVDSGLALDFRKEWRPVPAPAGGAEYLSDGRGHRHARVTVPGLAAPGAERSGHGAARSLPCAALTAARACWPRAGGGPHGLRASIARSPEPSPWPPLAPMATRGRQPRRPPARWDLKHRANLRRGPGHREPRRCQEPGTA